jgi:putative ABC transport system permease protein
VYIPFTTFQRVFGTNDTVDWLAMTAKPEVNASHVEAAVRNVLMVRHGVAPDDGRALGSLNAARQYRLVQSLFRGVNALLWVVGIATLFAGVLGVSNIMLISVKERTYEFGIRKALGATPLRVVAIVAREAALLTTVAGYAGLVAGVFALEGIARFVREHQTGPLGEPSIELKTALLAMLVLIAAAIAAGITPALHVLKIHPVEALRDE